MEALSLQYENEHRIAANEGGFDSSAEWRHIRAEMASRNDEIKELQSHHQDIIYDGDVRCDALVITEHYNKSSTESQGFRILYGITPESVINLSIVYKFA